MELSDARWEGLAGGYRVPYDPRPALRTLYAHADTERAWAELWNKLHHQGRVGEASYASVPHIVAASARPATPHWNAYALVGTIELARTREGNPPLPEWLTQPYTGALADLAARGLSEFVAASSPELVRSILAILAISKGRRTAASLLLEFTEDELLELIAASEAG
jgi:hypothetical protein